MNLRTLAMAVFAFGAIPLFADEVIPALKIGQNVYSNAVVFKVTATDIYFRTAQGMGNARLKNLDPSLQKHFHFNPTNSAAIEHNQAAANAQYLAQAARQPKLRPPDETRYPASMATMTASDGDELDRTLGQAKAGNKMVLLDFTGSDWCGWCIKFKQDVLSTPKFSNYAARNLILEEVDFPHSKAQSDAVTRNNAALKQRFHVDGYPTFVLLNGDGKELGRQVGYLDGGPNAFIAELERFSK